MYFLLKIVMFYCYVRLPGGNSTPPFGFEDVFPIEDGDFPISCLALRGVFRDGLAGKTRGNCWDVLLVLSSWSINDNLFISRL